MDTLNDYLLQGNVLTEGMAKLIDGIVERGYPISRRDDGGYLWERKHKQ